MKHKHFTIRKNLSPGCNCLTCITSRIKEIFENLPVDRTKVFTELESCLKFYKQEDKDHNPISANFLKKFNHLIDNISTVEDFEVYAQLELINLEIRYTNHKKVQDL